MREYKHNYAIPAKMAEQFCLQGCGIKDDDSIYKY
jgi:hypothetical protein